MTLYQWITLILAAIPVGALVYLILLYIVTNPGKIANFLLDVVLLFFCGAGALISFSRETLSSLHKGDRVEASLGAIATLFILAVEIVIASLVSSIWIPSDSKLEYWMMGTNIIGAMTIFMMGLQILFWLYGKMVSTSHLFLWQELTYIRQWKSGWHEDHTSEQAQNVHNMLEAQEKGGHG